eukprot:6847496-Alexandrium_andersonii.AAC.1
MGYAPLRPRAREQKGKGKGSPKVQAVAFVKNADYCFAWGRGGRSDDCSAGRARRCIFCGAARRLRDCPAAPRDAL